VRVGANERVGVRDYSVLPLLGHDDAREILQIHLMNDSGVRRDDLEIVEGFLSPAEEGIPLAVARELELGVQLKRVGLREIVHLHRMVDHEFDRLQRVHTAGVAAEPDDAVAHRREVHDGGNAGEVLQEHARGREGNLLLDVALQIPPGQRFDVPGLHEPAVFVAQQVFEQDFHRIRQTRDSAEPGVLQFWQAVNLVRLAPDGQ
jgi:hypothetical protein